MGKPEYSRTRADLKREFAEQLKLLRIDCKNFDDGVSESGKRIALSLRLLLNQVPTEKQGSCKHQRALMDSLGLRGGYFLSSVPDGSNQNLLSESPLLVMKISEGAAHYYPLVSIGGGPFEPRPMHFSDWWAQPIIKDRNNAKFSRMELVLCVASKDGGAHADQTLPMNYAELSRNNSLGWTYQFGGENVAPGGRPELACMRQIAHELLCTVQKYVPEFAEHAEPVVPFP